MLQIAERMKDFCHVDFPKKRLEVATLCLNVYEAMEKVFREQGIKVELDITDGFGCFIFENEALLNSRYFILCQPFRKQKEYMLESAS